METPEKFEEELKMRVSTHEYLRKLDQDIESSIEAILAGGKPTMAGQDGITSSNQIISITLDDDRLYTDIDLYIQLVCKQLAVHRYQCYQMVQKLMKDRREELKASRGKGSSSENSGSFNAMIDPLKQDVQPKSDKLSGGNDSRIKLTEADIMGIER